MISVAPSQLLRLWHKVSPNERCFKASAADSDTPVMSARCVAASLIRFNTADLITAKSDGVKVLLLW